MAVLLVVGMSDEKLRQVIVLKFLKFVSGLKSWLILLVVAQPENIRPNTISGKLTDRIRKFLIM